MKIKVKKYVYKKVTNIRISRIDCTAQNILKLINLFEFHNILAIIDAEEDLNPLFSVLKGEKVSYSKVQDVINHSCTNVSFFSTLEKFKSIIFDAFKYRLEDIFIVDIGDEKQWKQYLENKTYFQERKHIHDNDPTLYISVNVNEWEIEITANNENYDLMSIVSKINEIFC